MNGQTPGGQTRPGNKGIPSLGPVSTAAQRHHWLLFRLASRC